MPQASCQCKKWHRESTQKNGAMMFTRLTEFKLPNHEFVTYNVADITDQRTPNAVSALVHDEHGERWVDLPRNFQNLFVIGKFKTEEKEWFGNEMMRLNKETEKNDKAQRSAAHR